MPRHLRCPEHGNIFHDLPVQLILWYTIKQDFAACPKYVAARIPRQQCAAHPPNPRLSVRNTLYTSKASKLLILKWIAWSFRAMCAGLIFLWNGPVCNVRISMS